MFDCHLTYSCIVWAQNINTINRLIILKKKASQMVNFKEQAQAHFTLKIIF